MIDRQGRAFFYRKAHFGSCSMKEAVANYCLYASGFCLIAFLTILFLDYLKVRESLKTSADNANNVAARATPGDPAEALSKIVEATSKLVEAITKAGPALSSLAAAVLFAMVAAYVVSSTSAPKTADPGAAGQSPPASDGRKPPS